MNLLNRVIKKPLDLLKITLTKFYKYLAEKSVENKIMNREDLKKDTVK